MQTEKPTPVEKIELLRGLITKYKARKELDVRFDDAFHSLLNLDKESEYELIDYKNLIVAIMSVFTNPKISGLLEDYYQKNIGTMLLSLDYFFLSLDSSDFEVFKDETMVKFASTLDEERADQMILEYKKLSNS